MNPFRSFAGMTRIRFEGFDRQVISARARAPLGTGLGSQGAASRATQIDAGQPCTCGGFGQPAPQAASASANTLSPCGPFSKVRIAR